MLFGGLPLVQYWQDSYDIVSKTAPQKTVMIHDVFNTSDYWADYWADKPHGSAMIDTHFYQVFVVDVSILLLLVHTPH